ncbi:class II glutamine amidotransferase [Sphaerisporangium sp. TRM90804]|uniref:class II glutamine amidotransferase n=1 Tax=Sphaerisporangium sp. TRM90804 TaxID=3031113 RepID=UPI00244862B4|nr:class II glutamine amidotransferase [Sphaerisporangium sp. TRM90804]MDH2426275.1 class II glutamine amidotransferase [Sphaerisporangium sp. TRM90804]
MCRHAAWLGAPRTLVTLLGEPRGLLGQSYAPRLQRGGRVNADGFGAGWYVPGRRAPLRYRRSVPIWADANLPGIASVARSACLLAAVRSATPGMPVEESATAPFTDGRRLLSHNGRVAFKAVEPLLDGRVPESACDSAWLAAAVFARLAAGAPLGDAVADVVVRAGTDDPGARLNLLVADGRGLAATAWNETLFLHLGEWGEDHDPSPAEGHGGTPFAGEPPDDEESWTRNHHANPAEGHGDTPFAGEPPDDGAGWNGDGDMSSGERGEGARGTLVASEPLDDRPGWDAVPDRHLVLATPAGVRLRPL